MGTRGDDSKIKLKINEEFSKDSEETVQGGKFEKRFVKTVRKIITLNKMIKVFEENERENRRVDMTDEFKMTLPIFDGNDYSTWKKRITIFLKMKKCEKVIQQERAEGENEATWSDTDLRAMNYI